MCWGYFNNMPGGVKLGVKRGETLFGNLSLKAVRLKRELLSEEKFFDLEETENDSGMSLNKKKQTISV